MSDKIRVIPQYEDKQFFDADYALLQKKRPDSKHLALKHPTQANDGFLLYDLMDVCTLAEIIENRHNFGKVKNIDDSNLDKVQNIVKVEAPKKKEAPKKSSQK